LVRDTVQTGEAITLIQIREVKHESERQIQINQSYLYDDSGNRCTELVALKLLVSLAEG
jgi:hypothetical protein